MDKQRLRKIIREEIQQLKKSLQQLNESVSADTLQKSISKAVYKFIFTKGTSCRYNDGTNAYACHASVYFVKNSKELKQTWWYKSLKFHLWNESKWGSVSKRLIKDNKRFSNKHINNLIEDIADGTVNGHSFISFNGYFIDPYLKSLRVPEKAIQQFCSYFVKIM